MHHSTTRSLRSLVIQLLTFESPRSMHRSSTNPRAFIIDILLLVSKQKKKKETLCIPVSRKHLLEMDKTGIKDPVKRGLVCGYFGTHRSTWSNPREMASTKPVYNTRIDYRCLEFILVGGYYPISCFEEIKLKNLV